MMNPTGPSPFVNVALYGENGHQIHQELTAHPLARLVAISEFPREKLAPSQQEDKAIRSYATLDELLDDPDIDFVSLCSPKRSDQAADAIRALEAGKHVFAEKPCAMTEEELDAILSVAAKTGCFFREMAATAFDPTYEAMSRIIQKGSLGDIVQIIAEKSYPYHDGRPQDEDMDGGLTRQCAIHAFRFVEHVAGVRIHSIQAMETTKGNPVSQGNLQMAACFMLRLENGGLASITANYLNPRGTGIWGDESLRILGTQGMVESTRGGKQTRLVLGNDDHGPLKIDDVGTDYLEAYFKMILGRGSMPLTLEAELSPTRWAIRAKQWVETHLDSGVV